MNFRIYTLGDTWDREAREGELVHWSTGAPIPAGTPVVEHATDPVDAQLVDWYEVLVDDGAGPEWVEALPANRSR